MFAFSLLITIDDQEIYQTLIQGEVVQTVDLVVQ